MNKAVILVLVFGLGGLCGYKIGAEVPFDLEWVSAPAELDSNPESVAPPAPQVAKTTPQRIAMASLPSSDDVIRLLGVQTPKSQFDGYRALQQLELLSPSAIQNILLSLDDSQPQLKGQIAWFLAGKFPEHAFTLMESSMGEELAATLFANLSLNQPQMTFEWLQQHESDFAFMFSAPEQQLERKMALLQSLSN